jgi:aminomethyltransferase
VFCRPGDAVWIWEALTAAGAPAGLVPAGLAARDTLRLEAGMPLYGNELGPDVTPFEAGLGRVVKFDKPGDFVGREALAARAAEGPRIVLAGLTIQSRRVARHGYAVLAEGGSEGGPEGRQVGTVTSGAPSPTLGVPIAMAYVEPGLSQDHPELAVDIRGQAVAADLTDLPFYRRSQ